MLTSGFFNSVNGDRKYNADHMSEIFEGLITDGVYESVGGKLAVEVNEGMNIQINTGRGWFGGKWVKNNAILVLPMNAADAVLNRYDAVVIKVDSSEGGREVTAYIKTGTLASSPAKPTMERTDTVKEYCLGYVYVGAGVSEITANNIEDTRGITELCGWVTGLIDQLDSTTLFNQFTAIFNEWFNGLADNLNENTETMLVAALPVSDIYTLTSVSWVAENGMYKQSVEVIGMNDTKTVLVQPEANSVTNYSAAEVRCTGQSANTLEFTAVTQPTEDINVNIIHMGV